jgi:hypothetical protein
MFRLSIREAGGAWGVHDDPVREPIQFGSETSAMKAAAGCAHASPAEQKVLVLYNGGEWQEAVLSPPRHQYH